MPSRSAGFGRSTTRHADSIGDTLIDGEPLVIRGHEIPPTVGADADLVPRARGWIHLAFAVIAVFAGVALVLGAVFTAAPHSWWATSVYALAVVAMFTISAVYHRVQWVSAPAEKWMMRLDHSAIFAFIAACYTPLAVLAMPPQFTADVLTIVWVGAAAGVALKMCWPSAPRWVGVPLYLLLGYVGIWFADSLVVGAGTTVVGLLIAGGVLYNVGAILYGARWPNPWPATFGHHEFFHAFTAAAAVCHFIAIWLVVHQG